MAVAFWILLVAAVALVSIGAGIAWGIGYGLIALGVMLAFACVMLTMQ